VLPGFIDVEEGGQHLDEAYKTAARSANPLGHPGAPADVARVILLLASPLAGYVSGAVVAVDGGSGAGRLALRPSGP
jgi:3-oxoacyl-[acyl-carrier protein] reductase